MTMVARCFAAFVVAAFLACSGGASAEDDQWVFREAISDGTKGPVASFLTMDYAWVAFRATCDRDTHELVIDYVDVERGVAPTEAISIARAGTLGEGALDLSTTFKQGWMTGRISVDPVLLSFLDTSDKLIVWTPDGENWWQIGRAEPLRRVVEYCR